MSTASAPPTWLVDSTRVRAERYDEPALAGERGVTVIRPRVVERVAAQAVREVADTAGTGRRVLGQTLSVPGDQNRADVRAHIDGQVRDAGGCPDRRLPRPGAHGHPAHAASHHRPHRGADAA